MNFLTAFHTDVGIKKRTNQESLLIHQAQTDSGNVLLAAIVTYAITKAFNSEKIMFNA